MPIHDYECAHCGCEFESVVQWDEYEKPCPLCKDMAKRTYKAFRGIQNDSPDYLNDILAVVDKDTSKPHCNNFLKHPNRKNYKAWMKGEKIRPMESGEGMRPNNKPKKAQIKRETIDRMQRNHKKREAISI